MIFKKKKQDKPKQKYLKTLPDGRVIYRIDKGRGDPSSFLDRKAAFFTSHKRFRQRKKWYFRAYKSRNYKFKLKLRRLIRRLASLDIRFKALDFIRWVVVDILRGKGGKHWGIYCYVANPGEGKTISMVAHMERTIKELGRESLYIATNFHYAHQDAEIGHWVDMIKAAKFALDHGKYCVLAMDEVHITFDATDWKNFPPEMMQLLSFNRKYDLQFLCSSQRYERIPKKIVGISNYTVLCENTLGLDRHFKDYYYDTNDYESRFTGKKKHAQFIKTFVAGDDLYALYDTKRQVDKMVADAEAEKDKRQEAFDLLFGKDGEAG